jgi:RNA polymerase sigma-70 factor (ECF subfamily)
VFPTVIDKNFQRGAERGIQGVGNMSDPGRQPLDEDLLRHASWIRSVARALVGDEATAEDLTQDTLVAALTHSPPAGGKLRPWLRQVVRNFARQEHRGRGRRATRESGAGGPAPMPSPDEFAERLDMERRLTDELARLGEPYRSTLMLRYYEDLAPAEIAARLGVPGGTVRWRIKHGLELLRARLDGAHGGERRAWMLLMVPLARPKVAAATGVAGTSVAVHGLVAMNGFLKLGAAAAVVVVVALGLVGAGVLPASVLPWYAAEAPLEVGFRPMEPPAPKPVDSGPVPIAESSARVSAPLASVDEEPEVVPAETTGEVVARTVDGQGVPIAGAELAAITAAGRIGPAASDADGVVRLEVPIQGERERMSLHLSAAGFASQARTVIAERGASTHAGTLELAPGGAVSGRVVDENGDPVAGARVSIGEVNLPRRRLESMRLEHRSNGPPLAATAANGEFRLLGVPAGHVRLWASGDGHKSSFTPPVEVRADQESFGVTLTLEPLGNEHLIRGVVLDPEGTPVPFASLAFRHSSGEGGRTINGDRTAGADGQFEFVLFADERLWLTAVDPEKTHGPASVADVRTGELDLVLQLNEVRQLDLKVVGVDDAPVVRYAFEVLSADEEFTHQSSEVAERPDGHAQLRQPSGPFLVRVTASGYALETTGVIPAASADDIVLQLTPVPGVRGVVRADGEPVAGARVVLQKLVGGGEVVQNGFRVRVNHELLDETRTDAEGRFVVTARAKGDYLVRTEHPDFAPADIAPVPVGGNLHGPELLVELLASGAIEGRVYLDGGRDPAGSIVGISRGDGHGRTRRVGADGRYRFEGLTPGGWRVELRHEEIHTGYLSISTGSRRGATPYEDVEWDCEVFAATTTYHDLLLAKEETWSFEGRLTVNGVPAEAWSAMLSTPGALPFAEGPRSLADADGRFVVNTDSPGEHRLVLHGPFDRGEGEEGTEFYLMDEVVVGAGAGPWRLDLETGSLVVTGLEPWGGEDVPPLVYVWNGPGKATCLAPLGGDEDGHCRLSDIPAGPARLVVPMAGSMDPDEWRTVLEVDVPPRGEATATLN